MSQTRSPTPDLIAIAVSVATGLSLEGMRSERRGHYTMARRIYARLCRERTASSYPAIARALGKRNHSSSIAWDQGYDEARLGRFKKLALVELSRMRRAA